MRVTVRDEAGVYLVEAVAEPLLQPEGHGLVALLCMQS